MRFNATEIDRFVSKVAKKLKKKSALEQMAVGVTIGWTAGYFAKKVGRMTAMALGGGLILLQLANERGIISVNWSKLEKDLEKKLQLKETSSSSSSSTGNEIIDWTLSKFESRESLDNNFVVAALGGFLLGLGF